MYKYYAIRHILTCHCQDKLTKLLLKYAEVVKPTVGKTADKGGVYVHKPGQVTGEIRCVRYWHAIGHSVSLLIFLLILCPLKSIAE
jgi:hypothetical protein